MAAEKLTLEQRRAQDAWQRSRSYGPEHVRLAKGLPALIMNSGLMQVMAFLNDKAEKNRQHREIAGHLRTWLSERFPGLPAEFEGFMEHLLQADTRTYQAVTAEAFAWLKWLRQLAAAQQRG